MPDPILDAIKAANKKSTQGYSDVYKGENNPSQYDRGMSINENDVEQFRYDRQGVLSMAGNIAAKTLANFALNAVDSATFLAITPIQAIFETATGTVGVDNLYSNFLSEGIDRTKEKLEELFPVYTSEGYRNDEILPSVLSMKTVDNIFNGLSYLTGEAAGIRLLAKYSPKVLGAMGRRTIQAVDEGEDLNKVGTLFAETKGLFGDFKKGKSALHDKFYQTYGAVVESAAEARQTQDQLYEQLLAEHEQKFGTVTEEDQANIKKISQEGGLYNFGLNYLITSGFNSAFNKLITSKYTNNMIDSKRIIEKEGQYAIKDLDKYQRAYRGLFGEAGRSAFDEGIQEVGQFASNDFILNYFGDSSNDSESNIDQMLEAGIKTSSKLNSREAIESGLIGALLGGGVTAISNRGQGAKKEAALKSGVEALNKQKENYNPLIKMMAKSQDKKEIMNGALLNGDIVTYETTKNNMFFDIADAYIETGKEEDLRRDLKTSKQLLEENEEEFKRTYLIKGEFDKQAALSTIDNTIEMVDKVKETRNQLMKNYGHSINKEGIRLLTMTEIMHDDFSKREGQIIDELNSAGIDYKDFIGKRSTENIQTIQNSMTDIQSKILTEKNKDKLNEYNSEIVRLQSKLNKQLINDNYLKEVYGELNNVEESKEKKKEDKFKTAQYKKQLDDLVTIQQLKGDVMDFHNKYINSGKARDRVAEQLKKKEINKISARDFTEGENTIDIGDRFSMEFPVLNTYIKGVTTPGEQRFNDEFVEVTDLSVRKGKGFITFKLNNGVEETLTADEFKKYRQNTGQVAIGEDGKPLKRKVTRRVKNKQGNYEDKVVEKQQYTDYKKSYDNPEVKFFNQFKDKAIEYTYKPKDKPLKTIIGKLAFNKDGQLILKYKQVATGKFGNFVKLQTVRFQGNNQYKILSDKEGLEFDLDYINTEKTIQAEKTREKLLNDKISAEKALTDLTKKKGYKSKKLKKEIQEFEDKILSIEKQIEHLDEVEIANIEDVENVYNIIPELKKHYYDKKQVPDFDISNIENDLINLSEEGIISMFGDIQTYNTYVNELQNGTPEQQLELLKSKNISTNELEETLREYREQERIENEELVASIQEKLPITKENILNILDNYIKQLNNFRKNLYTKPYFYTFNKVADPNSSNEEEKAQKFYSRPRAGVRTTGNSEKTDNVFKQRFYRNIHRIDPTKHKAVLIQDNTKYNLGEGIFFLIEDQTTKENLGITTLILPTLGDNYGERFRLKNGQEKVVYKEIFDSGDLNSVKTGVSTYLDYTGLKSLYNKLLVKYKGKEDHTSIVKQIFEDMLLPLQQLRANTKDQVLDIDSVVLGIPIKNELRSIRETVDKEYLDESTIYTNITKSGNSDYSEVVVGKQAYNLRVGQTYIKNDKKGNVIRIQGQKINQQDSTNLINGLIALQKEPANRHLIKETLSDRFYFNSGENKSFLDYFYNDEAELVYSYKDDTRLVLKFSDLINNPTYVQEVINRITDNIYYSVSNEKLKNNEFYRFKDIDSDGNIVESNRTYDSYSDYVKETFSTNLVPLGNKQFENGHINFDLKIDKTDLIEEQKEEIKEQTAKAGNALEKLMNIAKEEESKTATEKSSTTEEAANDPFAEDDELATSMAAAKAKNIDISGSSLAAGLTANQSSEPPSVSKLADEANKFNDFLLSTNSELEYQGWMEQEDYDKATQRIKDRYDIDLQVVENLIETEGAWGKVTRFADFILNKKAIIGTDFHEEFHIVSNFVLTPEEQQRLYKESGQTEEELAEDYRYYALGMEKKGFIKETFDKITKFLKRILSLNDNQSFKNEVFKNIYAGKYKLRNKKNNFPHYSKAALTEAEKTKVFDRGLHIASKFIRGVLNKENPNLGLIQAISDGKLLSELLNNDKYVGSLLGRDSANLLEGSLGVSLNQLDLLERANNNPGIENEFKQYATIKLKTTIEDVEEEIYELLGEEKPKDSIGNIESNTINHFEKAQSKLRLFLYSITEEGEPYGLDRALNKLYKDLVNKHDSKEFFDFIRTSKEPFYQQITEKLLLNQTIDNKDDLNNVLKFQNTFYAQLAKMKNEYMVLKVEKNGQDERVYFINATKEKHIEQLIDKYYNNLKDNFVDNVNTDNIVQAFENIGIRLPNINIKENFKTLENSYSFIKKGVKEAADLKGKEVKTKIRSSLVSLAEIEIANTDTKAVYNVYNAGGKPVFTIQNFHGLFKRFPNHRIVPLNGIQSDLFEGYMDERGNFTPNVVDKDITTPKLGLSDLNALYFNSVMEGITPYTFAGDKSTLWGIYLTPTIGKKVIDLKPPTQMSKSDFIATRLRPIIEASYEYQLSIFNNGYTDDFMAFFKTDKHEKISFKEKTKEEIAAQKDQLLKFYKTNKNKLIAETVKEIEERAIATEKYFIANNTILQLEENGKPRWNDYPFFTYEALYTMGQMEMTREIGDLAFYNDPTKRLYGLTSAKSNIRHDKEYIDQYNKLHGTNISEQTRSVIVNDVELDTEIYQGKDGKKGVNASDAQGYINYDSALFMLRSSGMFDENVEKLDKVLSNPNSTIEQIEKASEEFETYLKALKPQGFGYNEEDRPVFYKLSVIPLHKHFTKGKNIDYIREIMEKGNLDMVMFKSANKVGTKSVKNLYNEGQFNTELLRDIKNDSRAIHYLDWKWFNIQVETSDRHNDVTSGTQARKQVMIDLPEVFDKPIAGFNTRAELVAEHSRLNNLKTDKMLAKLTEELDLNPDFTPKSTSSLKRIKIKLLQEAISRDTPREFQRHIERLETYDLINNKFKLESIILSMLDMTKHKMSGDMKVQVSSVGFEKKFDSKGNPTNILKDKALSYVDGKMEVYLPYHYAKYFADKVTLNPETNIYELNSGVELPAHIGYRIPTQYINAIDTIVIKGFTSGFLGNSVVVPFEITTKTGSDFDVDKLSIFFPNYKKTDKGYEYDTEDNDNKIIELYNHILDYQRKLVMEPNNQEIINPIFDDIQKDKGVVTTLSKKDFLNPSKITKKTFGFKSAKDTLGIQAVNSSSHAVAQMFDVEINDIPLTIQKGKKTLQIPKLSTLLASFEQVVSDLRLSKLKNVDGQYISQVLSQTVDATVDVAAQDKISAVNFNPETSKVANLLIRSGVSTREIFYLLNNPAVIEYIEQKYSNKSGTSIIKSYPEHIDYKSGKVKVVDNINTYSRDILALYMNLEHHGDKLDTFNKVITFDTKGVGTNTFENLLLTKQYEISEQELRNYFKNFDKVFDDTFIGKFKNLADNVKNQTDILFPLKKMVREINDKTIIEIINSKTSTVAKIRDLNKRENRIATYFIQKNLYNKYEISPVGEEIKQLRKTYDNKLLNDLVISEEDGKEVISLYNGSSLNTEESNQYSKSWLELYDTQPSTALKLAIHSYFQSGTINSPITLFNIIPYNIKKELDTNYLKIDDLGELQEILRDSDIQDMFTREIKPNIKDNTLYTSEVEQSLLERGRSIKDVNGNQKYTDEQILNAIKCL